MKLIIIPSFGTNSKLLDGLRLSLNRAYDAEVLDLPGFASNTPELNEYGIKFYVEYLQKKLQEINEDFILAGVSFGFYLLSLLDLSKMRVKGVIAMEPFLGYKSLKHLKDRHRRFFRVLIKLVLTMRTEKFFFNAKVIRYIFRSANISIDFIKKEFKALAFFSTLYDILSDTRMPFINEDYKYALLLNPEENTLNFDYVKNHFIQKNTKYYPTTVKHYPDDLSQSYFDKNISDKLISEILEYLS